MPGSHGSGDGACGSRRDRQGRRPAGRAGGRDHGRQAHLGADSSLPPAGSDERDRRLRVCSRRGARAGQGSRHGSDWRRDGGAHRSVGGRADVDRHDQGYRAGRLPRDRAAAREIGRPIRHLEARIPPEAVTSAHVITVSDRVSAGTMSDGSGPALVAALKQAGFSVSGPEVVPDSRERITEVIIAAASGGADVVVTTGGTGVGPRDVTPQATAALLDFEVPGIGEEMRRAGAASTPLAALSRSMAGVLGRTLIINLPGSVKGATESLAAAMPLLAHAVQLLHGDTTHR